VGAKERRQRRAKVIPALIERDGDRCFYCGCVFGTRNRAPTLDHKVPRSNGGRSNVDNLRLVCYRCNRLKGNQSEAEFLSSRALILRRETILLQQTVADGKTPPKRWFHHAGIVWLGEGDWRCEDCGAASATESPTRVICRTQRAAYRTAVLTTRAVTDS